MGRHSFSRLTELAAWASIGLIAYLTLAHIGVVYSIYFRLAPWLLNVGIGKYVAAEHFGAFALFGALCFLAYPKRILMICLIVFGSAIILELMQTLTPDRHGTLLDALEKIAGGGCGIFIAKTMFMFWQRRPVEMDA
jgi:VanZ family protein